MHKKQINPAYFHCGPLLSIKDILQDPCIMILVRHLTRCLSIVVSGQLFEMSDTAVYLGHTVASTDRDNITKSAKSRFWKSFNILRAGFGKL